MFIQKKRPGGIPQRQLGMTGEWVSIVCMGGWHVGHIAKEEGEGQAEAIMHEALDRGVNFFDNSWDYHDGYAESVMGLVVKQRRDDVFLMTKNCRRDYAGSKQCLEDSLRRLQTDHLDLWQFHECNFYYDPDRILMEGGLRAAVEALQAGKVRFVGFTGHKNPAVHRMMSTIFKFDTAQMPINACDAHYHSFQALIPDFEKLGIGVIGMKSLGGRGDDGRGILLQTGLPATMLIAYALSQPISSLVMGIGSRADFNQAMAVATDFDPLSEEEQQRIRELTFEDGKTGHLELFKTTSKFDGHKYLNQCQRSHS